MPAMNAPSAIDTPKTSVDATAMPSASTRTVSVNSSRERVAATRSRSFGIVRVPTTPAKTTSKADLQQRQCDVGENPEHAGIATGQRRQQDEHDDGQEILDDQPANGDVTTGCVQLPVVGKHAHQDDGAGHR